MRLGLIAQADHNEGEKSVNTKSLNLFNQSS